VAIRSIGSLHLKLAVERHDHVGRVEAFHSVEGAAVRCRHMEQLPLFVADKSHSGRDPQPIVTCAVRLCSRATGPRARRAMRLGLAGRNGGGAVGPCYWTGPTAASSAAAAIRTGGWLPRVNRGQRICLAAVRRLGGWRGWRGNCPAMPPARSRQSDTMNRRQSVTVPPLPVPTANCPAVPLRDAKNVVGGIRQVWGRFAAVGSVICTARRHGIDAYQRFAIRYRATSRSAERCHR
jgi:hypothetical protein